jgi:hypothetical protein
MFLVHGRKWCAASKRDFHIEALPENLQTLLRQVENVAALKPASKAAIKSNWALAAIRISIPQTMMVLKDDRHFNRPPEKSSAGVNTP